MKQGFLSIVLHAHLPYVHHPEHAHFFEENWLFEAITECYLPLLGVLDRLDQDAIHYRLTLSLSPTLMTMLQDDLLITRYLRHLNQLLELSTKEIGRTQNLPELNALAHWYRQFFCDTLDTFQNRYQCDLLAAFKAHESNGRLELITTAATHGFLPALNVRESAVRNQIETGIETFQAYFGHKPAGFWLPECAYYPGLETLLAKAGIRYFFVDSHAILHASLPPVNGVFAPLDCGNGIFAFGRDPESSRQVWSAQEGYPGDGDYREYYRDIGFDLDLDDIAPFIPDGQVRASTGIKYYRVTGGNGDKALYNPAKAAAKAREHARDFVAQRQRQVETLCETMDRPPVIVAPYDAELFGHWWFEGPIWLENVLRLTANSNPVLQTATCSDTLALQAQHQNALPSASTWGEEGYYGYWINEETTWIYPYLHQAQDEMEKLATDLRGLSVTPLQERALNQAARSLLLAQASDWPFILKSGTTRDYARKRITDHLARFNYLHDSIRKNKINERYLIALETLDDIFPTIDFRTFSPDSE
jgi:1,4-alpha-glucan branching enzyme